MTSKSYNKTEQTGFIMAYRMVCIDLDGTLLNKKCQISVRTRESLRKAHDIGVEIVICTGRSYLDAIHFSDDLGVGSPVIASNGALIVEKEHGRTLYESVIGKEMMGEITRVLDRRDVRPFLHTRWFAICGVQARVMLTVGRLAGVFNHHMKTKTVLRKKSWPKMIERYLDHIVKCEIINKDTDLVDEIRRELEKIPGLEVTGSSKNIAEMTVSGISKGSGVAFLAKRLGIAREEIMTIGDSGNDIKMIQYAGLGVAMANADPQVKTEADYITASNNEDGIAEVIEKFILNV